MVEKGVYPYHHATPDTETTTYLYSQGRRCVLSRLLQRYCSTFADRDVRDHVLSLLHTHLLSALPWHHISPSTHLLSVITKVGLTRDTPSEAMD